MKSIAEFLAFTAVFTIALTFGVKAIITEKNAPETAVSAVSGAISEPTLLPNDISSTTASKISAQAATLVYVNGTSSRVLFQKNASAPMLIASITKLLTAIIASENIPNTTLAVSKSILQKRGAMKKIKAGSSYSKDILYKSLLVESNNDAAWVFAENMGAEEFIGKLNERARDLGLADTKFGNPNGVDPADNWSGNYSSANDLVTLSKYLYNNYQSVLETTRIKEIIVTDVSGKNTYVASSTNKLLTDNNLQITVIGGKTGETPKSGKNLLLIFKKDPFPGYFISAVLNSKDNFKDTKELANAISPAGQE